MDATAAALPVVVQGKGQTKRREGPPLAWRLGVSLAAVALTLSLGWDELDFNVPPAALLAAGASPTVANGAGNTPLAECEAQMAGASSEKADAYAAVKEALDAACS